MISYIIKYTLGQIGPKVNIIHYRRCYIYRIHNIILLRLACKCLYAYVCECVWVCVWM